MQSVIKAAREIEAGLPQSLTGVPDGLEARIVGDLALENGKTSLFVIRDGQRMVALEQAMRFVAPGLDIISLPAWDCLPYDRVSPSPVVSARRMAALAAMARPGDKPRLVLTSANAVMQRVPSRQRMLDESWSAAPGQVVSMDDLVAWLEGNGFLRAPTVRETGEYAVRGGIVDLFLSGAEAPVRLDFFGDTLESIRAFDAETQRSVENLRRLDLVPMSEVTLTDATIKAFRTAYLATFGASTRDDLLYQAVSDGKRYAGLEHWLAFFDDRLDSMLSYIDGIVVMDHLSADAIAGRQEQVRDHYQARLADIEEDVKSAVPYKPAAPETLYLDADAWASAVRQVPCTRLSPFEAPEGTDGQIISIGGRQGRTFAAERTAGDTNVFDAVVQHLSALRADNRKAVIACWSEGTRERMAGVMHDHGLERLIPVESWTDIDSLKKGEVGIAVYGIETGFETPDLAIIAEQDILGDRFVRTAKKRRKKGSDFLTEVTGLSENDLVVHVDHGIGQFIGLKTITAAGAPHDCLELMYQGGDKLFLPVENIELLSRYGSEEMDAVLDKLGGVAWQAKKARLKERIREMADQLIKVAAARELKRASVIKPPEGLYDEFAARFPFEETDDQLTAIDAVFEDLAAGRPMDRLICGDVGFGKTEVALRAAFIAVMSGRQVAIVVPTTLLARQHYKTFADRFAGFPVEVAQASRLVTGKALTATKKGLKDGTVDIVVGTHALLGKSIEFRDLGLLIVDEEQHFGVAHKERLKELKADMHVMTLSATPIPRTLQLALTGVRELSLMATPPVDRLAVRTFVSPFDGLVIREALLRELYRGGQSFYVCPRVADLPEIKAFLEESVPEVRVAVAHGQMSPTVLEDIMSAFYDGKYDVLLSTTIVESGIDIPSANTLIVHRADMFGLSQLYQLRGRVGRSKARAYALFTVPAKKKITPQADRRLKVLQSLDTLGAGFQLASHDLDIRGAGNLLGDEQSGHIKEVGYELYQSMLEEAVAQLRSGMEETGEEQWSPQITIGTPVLIPETYIKDLQLRLGLYRRLGAFETSDEIDAFGAELRDRFGPLPDEVQHLLKIVYIKALCRRANIEKVDAGPKGLLIALRENTFANPAGLVRYIGEQGTFAKIRPDQKIVLMRQWDNADDRLKGVAVILTKLVQIAEAK